MCLESLQKSGLTHLTVQEVDAAALHFEGASLWIIMHCPAHIQLLLSPSFNDSLIPH